jgi:hypothetical protein
MTTRRQAFAAIIVTGAVLSAPTVAPEAAARDVSPAVAVSDCWPTDNGDPVLTDLSVSPKVVDVTTGRADVTFQAMADDTGGPGALTGVRRIRVAYGRTATQSLRQATLHRDGAGRWVGSLPFYPGSGPAGLRTVTNVRVEDWAGNERDYAHAELVAMGFAPLDFDFVAPVPDRARPRLRSLRMSRETLDLRTRLRTVTFLARLTDDVSGVTDVELFVTGPFEHLAAMHRVRGTGLDGWWRGRVTLDAWEPRGRRDISVDVTDGRSRTTFLDSSDLEKRGMPSQLRVLARVDRDAPSVTASVSPAAVDVRTAGATVHVVVRASDRTSGIAEVRVGMYGPEYVGGSPQVLLRRASGTARHGRWEGDIGLTRCTSPAGTWQLYVYAIDRAINSAPEVSGITVQVQALDHVRPTAEVAGASTPDDPLTLRFSEDVTNLGGGQAEVRGGPEGEPEVAVPGSWLCRAASGTAVDCATGALRLATFTPSQPWPLGSYFYADLAPSGAVGVRDLAGNPIDGSQAGGVFLPGG